MRLRFSVDDSSDEADARNGKEVGGRPIKTLTILSTDQNCRHVWPLGLQADSSLAAHPGKRIAFVSDVNAC